MSDLLNLTDEELMATDLSTLVLEEPKEQSVQETPSEEVVVEQEVSEPTQTNEQTETPLDETATETNETEVVEPEVTAIDYQAFYETMTKPFKANGREIKIENADDAIRLMQMGANYSKKMESLKPNLGLVKLLEQNGLTNKEQLAFLVDLKNKKPEAVAKFIQESNIDLYDFDASIAENYTPSANVELAEPTAFESTLEELLEQSPEFNQVLTQMSGWDSKSKSILYDEPKILRELATQQANGLYDKIVNVVESERLLGRLTDMTYLEAYATVETMLKAKQQENKFVAPKPQNTKPSTNSDKKLNAGMPQKAVNAKGELVDLSALSDDEIMKLIL